MKSWRMVEKRMMAIVQMVEELAEVVVEDQKLMQIAMVYH